MRLLGFITGVTLLAFLYILIREPQLLSMDKFSPDAETKILQLPEPETFQTSQDQAIAEANKAGEKSIFNPVELPSDAPNESAGLTADKEMATQPEPEVVIPQPLVPKTSDIQSKNSGPADKGEESDAVGDILGLEKAQNIAGLIPELSDVVSADTVQWHQFWGPFRTRLSAQGFANNLVNKTEIDLKVIEKKPGAFMVAFPYASETERQLIAATIEEQTGLKLGDR